MLSTMKVKVSRKNQIAVPAAARKRLGIKPGDWLEVEIEGYGLRLRPGRDPLRELIDLAPEIWRGVDVAEYIRDLREE